MSTKAAMLIAGVLLSHSALADLIIRNGATLNVNSFATLDVNCNDVTIESGATVNLTSGTIDNVLNLNQAPGGTLVNPNGTLNLCRPQLSAQAAPEIIELNGVSRLTFEIDNPASTPATGLSFSNTFELSSGIVVSTPPNASTTCLNGNVTAVAGASSLSLSGGQISAASSCEVSVDVSSSVAGEFVLRSGELSSSVGISDGASTQLTVLPAPSGAQPLFSMAFSPDTVSPANLSTLRYQLSNPSSAPITGITFSNSLPSGVTIADTNATTDCSAASLSAPNGGATVDFSNGALGAGASCSIDVLVVSSATAPTTHTNTTGILTSSGGITPPISSTLTIDDQLPSVSMAFTPSTVTRGSRSRLIYTIDNTSSALDILGIELSDELPDSLIIASPARASTNCSAPVSPTTLTALAGSREIDVFASFFASSVEAGVSCTIEVDVIALESGDLTNVIDEFELSLDTIPLSFELTPVGQAAATLSVISSPLEIVKRFIDNPAPPGTSTNTVYTLTNLNREFSASELSFSDDLSATLSGLEFTSVISNTCGGSLAGVGTSLVSLSGAALPPLGSCAIEISSLIPASTVPDEYPSSTGAVSATVNGLPIIGNIGSDILFAVPAPEFTKQFIDNSVSAGGSVTVEYTVRNTSTTSSVTEVAFRDAYPTVLTPTAVLSTTGCDSLGPNLIIPGFNTSTELIVNGLVIAPGASCVIEIDVSVNNDAPNSSVLYATQELTGNIDGASVAAEPAADTLTIVAGPDATVSFAQAVVARGDVAELEFTLQYGENAGFDATNISFSNDFNTLFAGAVATLPALPEPPCGPGSTLDVSVGGDIITLAGGTLTPGQTCSFSANVQVPNDAAYGAAINTSSVISADVNGVAVTSLPAEAELLVTGLSISSEILPNSVLPGETVTLRYELDNIDNVNDVTSISFVDDNRRLFASNQGLEIVDPLPVEPCGVGSTLATLTGAPGVLVLASGQLVAASSCTFEVQALVPADVNDGVYSNGLSVSAQIDGTSIQVESDIRQLEVESTRILLSKVFSDDLLAPGDGTQVDYTITNLDQTRAISAIGFNDNFGAVINGVIFDSVVSNTCSEIVSGNSTGELIVSAVALSPGDSCTISASLSIPADAPSGVFTSTTGPVTGNIGATVVTGVRASDELTIQSFDFTKTLSSNLIPPGGVVTLSYFIQNNGNQVLTDGRFSEDFGSVITGLAATGLPEGDVCGEGSEVQGTRTVAVTGLSLQPGESCRFDISLSVPSTAPLEDFTIEAINLFELSLFRATSNELAFSVDSITIPPALSSNFNPASIQLEDRSRLQVQIISSANAQDVSNINLSANLPTGLTIASTPNTTLTCLGEALSIAPGSSTVSLLRASLVAGQSCSVSFDVMASSGGSFAVTFSLTSSAGSSVSNTSTLLVIDDRDSDGILNAIDNCPNIANANQADLDQDGQGDVCDSDIDGDQLPNDYETENGLDPRNSFDQRADPDGDGFNNLEEFQFGTDPNVANVDLNGNGVPDVVDRIRSSLPSIMLLLLLDDAA